jgi:hypothetical protein
VVDAVLRPKEDSLKLTNVFKALSGVEARAAAMRKGSLQRLGVHGGRSSSGGCVLACC